MDFQSSEPLTPETQTLMRAWILEHFPSWSYDQSQEALDYVLTNFEVNEAVDLMHELLLQDPAQGTRAIPEILYFLSGKTEDRELQERIKEVLYIAADSKDKEVAQNARHPY
jgi:hypothetical protein